MAHDRTRGDELLLTHEFLALMLAVRRPGATEAINDLKHQKLIDAARGTIVVLNRKGLEKIAGSLRDPGGGIPAAPDQRCVIPY